MASRARETSRVKRLLGITLLLFSVCLPVLADDAQTKALVIQSLRTRKDFLSIAIVERFFTIKASPEVAAVLESESVFGQYSYASCFWQLSNSVVHIAKNQGWGDVADLCSKTSWDNPLVASMLDSWSGKIAFTVDLSSKIDAKYSTQVVDNLTNTNAPFDSSDFKPRGDKAMITIKVDPTKANLDVRVSKDGNSYVITMPAYTRYVQYDLQAALRKGN